MKSKILIITLVVFCALLVFETGYLVGVGQGVKRYRQSVNQHRSERPMGQVYGDWEPLREMSVMQENMKRMFNDNFSGAIKVMRPAKETRKRSSITTMTSGENAQAYIITIALTDMAKEDINIEIKGRYLTIQAKRNKETRVNKEGFQAEELSAANFSQIITLPDDANISQISTDYHNGILTIKIPKNKEAKPEIPAVIKIPVK